MALSAKQRNGIENAIEWLSGLGAVKDAIRHDQEHAQEIYQAVDILRDLLTTSKPAWEATEVRKAAILDGMMAILRLRQIGEEEWGEDGEATVLRAMLDEVD